jgi:membrane-bound ClpP family serine protease
MHRRNVVFFLLIWLAIPNGWSAFSQDIGSRTALVIEIKGAIGPAIADYFARSLEKAEESNAAVVILQMDTPGGFDHSMRDIIKTFSPLPFQWFRMSLPVDRGQQAPAPIFSTPVMLPPWHQPPIWAQQPR